MTTLDITEKIILLEEDCNELYKIVRCIIEDSKSKKNIEFPNIKFHHNRSYKNATNVIKYGILSLQKSYDLGLINITEEILRKYALEDHVNGIDNVSLASTDVDYSRVRTKDNVYCHKCSYSVDFLVSNNVVARRNSHNHYNEYLVAHEILQKEIQSLDIRILTEITKKQEKYGNNIPREELNNIIIKYNYLRYMAKSIIDCNQEENIDISFREMSNDNITLDIEKMSKVPVLVLK